MTQVAKWEISKIANHYDEYSVYDGDTRICTAVAGKDNANLISTAKDMLKALEAVDNLNLALRNGKVSASMICAHLDEILGSVIAKAKGY